MALNDPYVTAAELKTYMTITGAVDDTAATNAVNSASRSIEKFCGRQFNNAGSATARSFYADQPLLVRVDDFHTTTGLVVKTDDDDDGTFETTWTSTDYQLEPLDGIVDGETGWPYNQVRSVEGTWFPRCNYRPGVQVTANWGWNAVPTPVKQAAYIVAAELFKLKDAPFGVLGFADMGVVRVRNNPMAASLLAPYRRHTVLVG